MRKKAPRVIDAEFEVIQNPANLPAHRKREPVIASWWNLFWFVVIFAAIALWKGYQNTQIVIPPG
jgi:hypothetical protein